MQLIPKPHILDPDRILDNDRGGFTADHKARADLLDAALHETCAYADHLWNDLNAMRKYLLDSLPTDPRAPGPHRVSATPSGPDDDQGWQNWIAAFAEVTSVLCGPHGDSGFGLGRARQEAQRRRDAPIVRIAAEYDEQALARPDKPGENEPSRLPDTPRPGSDAVAPRPPKRRARGLVAAIVTLLAIRGLRPRQRTN